MKFNHLIVLLILFPLSALSHPKNKSTSFFLIHEVTNLNTQIKTYSNESTNSQPIQTLNRSLEFPTQIIRMNTNIEKQQLSCTEVHDQINKIVVENIVTNQFTYAIYVSCRYDPQTFLAIQFTINAYFDPINDEAVAYLKSFLNEYNGTNVVGSPLKIESAKGLIISLNIAAGMKKNPRTPPFTEYRKDRSNFYFKSNYDMKIKLFSDIYANFYSNNADQVLPFLDKWIFAHASSLYKTVLRDSNYIELQPERIFLMENGEELFVSGLKQYFVHHCEQYENHRCLNPT